MLDMSNEFTFHNVSINSKKAKALLYTQKNLHSTIFLLILIKEPHINPNGEYDLHSTMFLLILVDNITASINISFTFHNVSINSLSKFLPLIFAKYIYIPQCFY